MPLRYTAFSAADASKDETGSAIDASHILAISAQAVTTGTSTGTLKFQASNDAPGVSGNPTNWTDIASQSVSIAGAGTYLIPKFDVSYQWLRVVFTHTNAAAGSITVNLKSIGF